jgi:hypothetical protein
VAAQAQIEGCVEERRGQREGGETSPAVVAPAARQMTPTPAMTRPIAWANRGGASASVARAAPASA